MSSWFRSVGLFGVIGGEGNRQRVATSRRLLGDRRRSRGDGEVAAMQCELKRRVRDVSKKNGQLQRRRMWIKSGKGCEEEGRMDAAGLQCDV